MPKHPTIGVALGSGGARGFAHLGVLKVLKQHEIPIDMISGSSMGALVGSFYASGLTVEQMYKLAAAFKRKYFIDVTVPKMGFIQGDRIKQLIRIFTRNQNIEDLPIPLAVVATDLNEGKKVVFRKGPVADAVRASISIPGIFVPFSYNGSLLVDGGVIERVPVSAVKEMGADIVIAVDVSHVKKEARIQSIFDVIMRSLDIMQNELAQHRTTSDVVICPRVEHFHSGAFTKIDEIIKLGEEEATKHIDEIKNKINQWKETNHEK
jgi:NTE family protein